MFIRSRPARLALAACAAAWAGAAQAHITLEQPRAEAGSTYKAVFRVGHGCDGAATHTLIVHLPPGVQEARPSPKAGWTVERRIGSLAQAGTSHGKTVTEGVRQIVWRGGPLDDAHYDEFVLRAKLPEQVGPLWFRVEQRCEGGATTDWAEVPASGTSTRGLKAPAALLEVVPPRARGACALKRATSGRRRPLGGGCDFSHFPIPQGALS